MTLIFLIDLLCFLLINAIQQHRRQSRVEHVLDGFSGVYCRMHVYLAYRDFVIEE